MLWLYHKVHIYKEYHSVCPLVGIGTLPSPLSPLASECAPPPGTKGGGGTLALRERGWGSPNADDWRKSFALYSTLWVGSGICYLLFGICFLHGLDIILYSVYRYRFVYVRG